MKFVQVAKLFVVVWTTLCLFGIALGALDWYRGTGRSISEGEWREFDAALLWWFQIWFFPTFGMIAVEFLFRDGTPMLAPGALGRLLRPSGARGRGKARSTP